MAGLTFEGSSPEYKIEDFFPDECENWWQYRRIWCSLTIEVVGENAAGSLYVAGGPFDIKVSTGSWSITTQVASQNPLYGPAMSWYNGQANLIATGSWHNYNPGLALNTRHTFSGEIVRYADGMGFDSASNGPGASASHSYTYEQNHNGWGLYSKGFFPDTTIANLYSDANGTKHINGARDVVFNQKPYSFFNGNLYEVHFEIDYIDGRIWRRNVNFETGYDDGWKYEMSTAKGTSVRFDTLRRLGGDISGGGAGGIPASGLQFDTLRKTKATFPGSAGDGTMMFKFDTLRRLGAPIGDVIGTIGGGSGDDVDGKGGDQLPTFDTYRHLGYHAVNEVDTKRIIDGAEIIVPVDTER